MKELNPRFRGKAFPVQNRRDLWRYELLISMGEQDLITLHSKTYFSSKAEALKSMYTEIPGLVACISEILNAAPIQVVDMKTTKVKSYQEFLNENSH